jgi:hypothetical protein
MNPYTTWARDRIQPRDVTNAVFSDAFTAAASLTVLERTRAYQAEAEVASLLKQHGVTPHTAASRVVMWRQAIGATLIRAGARLARTGAIGASPGPAPMSGILTPAD